jgi:hypothetical protein
MARRFLLGVTFLLAGCDGAATATDAGPDAPEPMACEAAVPFETGSEGHAMPLGASATEARAGRLTEAMLPVDRTGLGVFRPGDFVLANDRIAILIEDAGDSDIYDRYGGRPVGLARVEEGALVDAADFGEIITGLGGNLVDTQSVTVMNDGSDGQAAVVRAVGPLVPLDFLGDLLPDTLRGDFDGWPAAIDYRLEPGSDRVEVVLHADVRSNRAARLPQMLIGFVQGYRMPLWTRADGFGEVSGDAPWIAFDGGEGVSYAWEAPEGRAVRLLLEETGVVVASQGGAVFDPCSRIELPLGSIAVGRHVDDVQAIASTASVTRPAASRWRSPKVTARPRRVCACTRPAATDRTSRGSS